MAKQLVDWIMCSWNIYTAGSQGHLFATEPSRQKDNIKYKYI